MLTRSELRPAPQQNHSPTNDTPLQPNRNSLRRFSTGLFWTCLASQMITTGSAPTARLRTNPLQDNLRVAPSNNDAQLRQLLTDQSASANAASSALHLSNSQFLALPNAEEFSGCDSQTATCWSTDENKIYHLNSDQNKWVTTQNQQPEYATTYLPSDTTDATDTTDKTTGPVVVGALQRLSPLVSQITRQNAESAAPAETHALDFGARQLTSIPQSTSTAESTPILSWHNTKMALITEQTGPTLTTEGRIKALTGKDNIAHAVLSIGTLGVDQALAIQSYQRDEHTPKKNVLSKIGPLTPLTPDPLTSKCKITEATAASHLIGIACAAQLSQKVFLAKTNPDGTLALSQFPRNSDQQAGATLPAAPPFLDRPLFDVITTSSGSLAALGVQPIGSFEPEIRLFKSDPQTQSINWQSPTRNLKLSQLTEASNFDPQNLYLQNIEGRDDAVTLILIDPESGAVTVEISHEETTLPPSDPTQPSTVEPNSPPTAPQPTVPPTAPPITPPSTPPTLPPSNGDTASAAPARKQNPWLTAALMTTPWLLQQLWQQPLWR